MLHTHYTPQTLTYLKLCTPITASYVCMNRVHLCCAWRACVCACVQSLHHLTETSLFIYLYHFYWLSFSELALGWGEQSLAKGGFL